jgi:hypothetical protein
MILTWLHSSYDRVEGKYYRIGNAAECIAAKPTERKQTRFPITDPVQHPDSSLMPREAQIYRERGGEGGRINVQLLLVMPWLRTCLHSRNLRVTSSFIK